MGYNIFPSLQDIWPSNKFIELGLWTERLGKNPNTAGLGRTSFCSLSFLYNVDEKKKKKNQFPARATVCVGFAHFPISVCVFSKSFYFLPQRNEVHRKLIDMYIVPVGVSVGVCVSAPWMEGCPVQGWFPPCVLSCWDGLQPLKTLNWNKQVRK